MFYKVVITNLIIYLLTQNDGFGFCKIVKIQTKKFVPKVSVTPFEPTKVLIFIETFYDIGY